MADTELPEITDGAEGGWADLTLTVESSRALDDGRIHIEARGRYQGRTVGFGVALNGQWSEQQIGEDGPVIFWGTGSLVSIGSESDAFVSALDDCYMTHLEPGAMRPQIDVQAASLTGNPEVLQTQLVKLKVFFNAELGDASLYAEAYLNLDLPGQRLQFHEKDQEYRPAIVRSLAETWRGQVL